MGGPGSHGARAGVLPWRSRGVSWRRGGQGGARTRQIERGLEGNLGCALCPTHHDLTGHTLVLTPSVSPAVN